MAFIAILEGPLPHGNGFAVRRYLPDESGVLTRTAEVEAATLVSDRIPTPGEFVVVHHVDGKPAFA